MSPKPMPDETDEVLLPPLPPSDADDEGNADAGQLDELLVELHDADDTDDESAFDLDIGVDLTATPSDTADEGDAEALELSIGQLLNVPLEGEEDDSQGSGEQLSEMVGELGGPTAELEGGDDAEGPENELPELDEPLPLLDGDDDGELGRDEELEPLIAPMGDDSHLDWATQPLLEQAHIASLGAVTSAAAGPLVLASSKGLFDVSFQKGEPQVGTCLHEGAVADVLRRGEQLVIATHDGSVQLVGATAHATPLISARARRTRQLGSAWLERAGARGETVLAATPARELWRSVDEDTTGSFELVALDGEIVALSSDSWPVFAVLERDGERCLARCTDQGRSFHPLPSEGDALRAALAGPEPPLLAARRSVVVVASEERGVAVSLDGGMSFNAAPGCSGPTAVTVVDGGDGETPTVWIALFEATRDRSIIVRVDPESLQAEICAQVSEPGPGGEPAAVEGLVWDAEHELLWALGELGAYAFQRSSSDS